MPQPRMYDYIWDYGHNYTWKLIDTALNQRVEWWPRMSFEERAFRSTYALKHTADWDKRTSNLLNDINKSLYNFYLSRRDYYWDSGKHWVLERKRINQEHLEQMHL